MKNVFKISIILALIFLSGLLNCGKNSNPIISTTEFTIDNFPHEIGTVWKYQRDDRLQLTIDTIFVRIDDTTRITDDSLFVYVVITDFVNAEVGPLDSNYWHISGDTVTYYKYEIDRYIIDKKIIFPLELGDNWTTGSFPPDSNNALQITPKTVMGKYYQQAYQIVRTGGAFNDYINDSYWCVPNIGLIQINENRISLGPLKNETWNLISFYEPDSFELTDFPLQIGASWTYKVYNNLIDCAQFVDCFDTCTVTIMDSSYNDFGSISENWLFDYPDKETIKQNELNLNKLLLHWHNLQIFFSLKFPFSVGNRWLEDFGFSRSYIKVVDINTVTTEAGIFKNAYHLAGQTGDCEEWATFDIWIAKNYGIVKLQFTSTTNRISETWDLKSYDSFKPADSFTIEKFPRYEGNLKK